MGSGVSETLCVIVKSLVLLAVEFNKTSLVGADDDGNFVTQEVVISAHYAFQLAIFKHASSRYSQTINGRGELMGNLNNFSSLIYLREKRLLKPFILATYPSSLSYLHHLHYFSHLSERLNARKRKRKKIKCWCGSFLLYGLCNGQNFNGNK